MSNLERAFDDAPYPVRRVLFEVSDSSRNRARTGIQRVCRRLCEVAPEIGAEFGVQCLPVAIEADRFFHAPQIVGQHSFDDRFVNRLVDTAEHAGRAFRKACAKVSPDLDDRVGKMATRLRKTLYPKTLVRQLRNAYRSKRRSWSTQGQEVIPQYGDVVLLVDSSWNLSIEAGVERAKSQGAMIVPLFHDLIPLIYDAFHQSVVRQRFESWFLYLAEEGDHFLSVSQSTSDDVRALTLPCRPNESVTEYHAFRLGADFADHQGGTVRREIQNFFATNDPVFLNVSTIEPRKNQLLLLEAMDSLWNRGESARLVIAGKAGWMSESLQHRLRRHEKLGESLFWIQDATDCEIAFLYQNARSFLFPSVVEGFGLPIIESLYHRTPVLASDTKVHREVGGNGCDYFQLGQLEPLVQLMAEAIRTPKPALPPANVLSWESSCRQLLGRITALGVPARFLSQTGRDQAQRIKPAA